MKLKPLADRVVLKQVKAEEKTKSGLILSSADRREGDAADGIRPEDMPPDENRPAAASAGNQVRAVSVGSNDGGPAGDRLDYRLCLEPGESEAEAIDARGLDCGEGGFEGLRMEEIVLVGKHQIGC